MTGKLTAKTVGYAALMLLCSKVTQDSFSLNGLFLTMLMAILFVRNGLRLIAYMAYERQMKEYMSPKKIRREFIGNDGKQWKPSTDMLRYTYLPKR